MKEIPPSIGIRIRGQSNSCSYSTNTGMYPYFGDALFSFRAYPGACGGGQANGNWGVLSGIYTPDGNQWLLSSKYQQCFGCVFNVFRQ